MLILNFQHKKNTASKGSVFEFYGMKSSISLALIRYFRERGAPSGISLF